MVARACDAQFDRPFFDQVIPETLKMAFADLLGAHPKKKCEGQNIKLSSLSHD